MFIQVSEFFSLFFETRFVMPLPSRLRCFRPLAKRSVAASGSMHFSLILLLLRLSDSIYDSQIAFAKCCTPVSLILFPLRSSSNM